LGFGYDIKIQEILGLNLMFGLGIYEVFGSAKSNIAGGIGLYYSF
jgi:hypothetical protein